MGAPRCLVSLRFHVRKTQRHVVSWLKRKAILVPKDYPGFGAAGGSFLDEKHVAVLVTKWVPLCFFGCRAPKIGHPGYKMDPLGFVGLHFRPRSRVF